jgi:hypothetical protein
MHPIDKNWTNSDGGHDGGVSTGIGFTISWQRGPLDVAGRNGAFLLEVMTSCRQQLDYYQNSPWACPENQAALEALDESIAQLHSRRCRRERAGTLGTHATD